MRKIHEVLRLHFEHGRSKRIARIISVSPTTVSDYVSRAKLADLSYPLPLKTDDTALERLLFPPGEPSSVRRPVPAGPTLHNEFATRASRLNCCGKSTRPSKLNYRYSAFCEHCRR